MSKVKPYRQVDQKDGVVVSEPAIAYNATYLQSAMLCAYTDEEFKQILADAEASGYIAHEEAVKEFEKWGFVK